MATKNKEDLIIVQFKQWKCIMQFGKYSNGRVAIELIGAEGTDEQFELIATATVNMPHLPCGPDEVYIKNYSENEGMTNALIEAGVIAPAFSNVATGFVSVVKHKLLIPIT